MNLDQPLLGAAQVAKLAHTDIVNIHTWTTRRFTDPYHNNRKTRRGGGRVRSYSIRDALRFFLMARLHNQYRTPLPQGRGICESVFGEDSFDPDKAGYLVIEEDRSGKEGKVRWFENLKTLAQHLADEPVSLVINVRQILEEVRSHVRGFMVDPAHLDGG